MYNYDHSFNYIKYKLLCYLPYTFFYRTNERVQLKILVVLTTKAEPPTPPPGKALIVKNCQKNHTIA